MEIFEVDNIKCYLMYATSRIMGLKLQCNDVIYVIVNVYFTCEVVIMETLTANQIFLIQSISLVQRNLTKL